MAGLDWDLYVLDLSLRTALASRLLRRWASLDAARCRAMERMASKAQALSILGLGAYSLVAQRVALNHNPGIVDLKL